VHHLRGKLTYANVVSTLCLCLLVGGGSAFAAAKLAKNSVGTKQIKNGAISTAKLKDGAVTGAKVAAGSLGNVPSATHAASADTATSAVRATTAASVESLPPLEPVHVATLLNGCFNVNPDLFGPAGFYKDGFGIVHLTGVLTGCTKNEDAFVLPPGFRPTVAIIHAVPGTEQEAEIEVLAGGQVRPFSVTSPSLGGISFRTN